MNWIPRSLLAIACVVCACSCTELPEPKALEMPSHALVPEFSGGPKTAEIADKKVQLKAEYEKLADAEAELDRKKMTLMTFDSGSTFGGHFGRSMRSSHRAALARSNLLVATIQEHIEQLRADLGKAGVVITTHY